MARCEICGHKIVPTQRFCGVKDCVNQDKIIPRCIKCNGLMYEGKETCSKDRQPCIAPEGNAVALLGKAEYRKVVT